MERESLFNLSPEERNIAERCTQNNLRKAGEENNPIKIGELEFPEGWQIKPREGHKGFTIEDLTGQEWEVRHADKKRGLYMVRRMNVYDKETDDREFIYRMFPSSRLVWVPKEKI